MPQIYRRNSDFSPRPPLEPRRRTSVALQPTDADGSFVFADVVRSGETSRLRRRGAMRIDHNAPRPPIPPGNTAGPSAAVPPARPILFAPSRSPSPQPNSEDGVPDEWTYTGTAWRDWEGAEGIAVRTVTSQTVDTDGIHAGHPFVLRCGGYEPCSDLPSTSRGRFTPAAIPGLPSATTTATRARPAPRTNGCGALVHTHAVPQGPRGVWMARGEPSKNVVGLDPAYCDHPSMDKLLKSACGCVREGIGCSVCGNTLGTRYIPCQAASDGMFAPGASHPPQPVRRLNADPFGPSYYNDRRRSRQRPASSPHGTQQSHLLSYYTFFVDRVSSTPDYSFPTPPASPAHEPSRQRGGSRPASPDGVDFGFRWSGSPQPYPSNLPPIEQPAVAPPMSPVFAAAPAPPLSRTSSQPRLLPPSRPARLRLDLPTVADAGRSMPGGVRLDADGVPLDEMDEPSSPDKIGNEGVAWSGR